MAVGMEMMMKAFGLDPEKIKEAGENFGKLAAEIMASQKRCEEKLDRVLAILEPEKENENG